MNSSSKSENSQLSAVRASATPILRRAFFGAASAAWRQLAKWSDRRRQRLHLDQLDAHLLKDIGITRKQARREADRWFFD
ncbi:DUF1127 domain-containing protein [Hoeflea sp.]|uniref:DUF1127 domain-containing protein n=1 Tax=Hoeflea sp. TaxID=1940281 RepID=UPI003BB04EF3